jgi:pimeloyl-ACP methyl ester carboxylesterase
LAPQTYIDGSVRSRDGTAIGYRQFGEGPGVVAVHGAGQAAQNLSKLAAALSDTFTVYVPDRRGRGRSGPPGSDYSLTSECEDLDALLTLTDAHYVFGLSSGAIISLHAALTLPSIQKVALYEPPLSIDHSTPIGWLPRYDQELAEGKLGSAMVTAIRGTRTAPLIFRLLPRFFLDPLLNAAARGGLNGRGDSHHHDPGSSPPMQRRVLSVLLWPIRQLNKRSHPEGGLTASKDDVQLKDLVPTMHYDAQLVIQSEGTLESFREIRAEVLLLGGTRSAAYLKLSLHALSNVIPHAELVEFPGLDHLAVDNSGKPERVAQELRRFFLRSQATERGTLPS